MYAKAYPGRGEKTYPTETYDRVRDALEAGKNVNLVGTYNSGKTKLVAQLIDDNQERGIPVQYMDARQWNNIPPKEFAEKLRDFIAENSNGEETPLVVIDEFIAAFYIKYAEHLSKVLHISARKNAQFVLLTQRPFPFSELELVYMEGLKPETAREFIEYGNLEEQIYKDPWFVEYLLKCGGTQPCFLNDVCGLAFDLLQEYDFDTHIDVNDFFERLYIELITAIKHKLKILSPLEKSKPDPRDSIF
jgi:hypothetical protein